MPSGLKLSGGNFAGKDAVFGSSSELTAGGQQGSPNMLDHQFMNPMLGENDGARIRDGEIESDGGGSGNDQENMSSGGRRRKRYHRHTEYQIQELETFFKNCPHPDDKQRKALSRELGLEPLQVKFWFQNKRTQMKMQHERHENSQLRVENETLRAENARLRSTLESSSCRNCGGSTAEGDLSFDEHHLRMENLQLREEIDRMAAIAAKCIGKPMPWGPLRGVAENGNSLINGAGEELFVPAQLIRQMGGPAVEVEKKMIVEGVIAAMEEFLQMAQVVEPLWVPAMIDGSTMYVLIEEEYFRAFPREPAPRRPGFRWEATRDSGIVMMNHANLVKMFMNVNSWAALFCGIVAKATPLELLSTGAAGNYDGALQLMNVEYQIMTPLAPSRETIIARLCKHQGDGIWAVMDVSLDGLQAHPTTKFRKRPSGCLIQQLPNGCSKITWIEHVEEERTGASSIYKPLINSGAAYGAKYWLSILQRQCERAACSIATEFPRDDVINIEGRRSILKLAERMVVTFCMGVGASSWNTWTTLSRIGTEEVKVMTHNNINDPGRPSGVVISVATSIWLPAAPKSVFDYFRNENGRDKWDILTKGADIFKMAHITTGEQAGNCIALLRVKATLENQTNMLILQESFTLPTGSFVIHAPIDLPAMTNILDGGDTNDIALLPSGFAILPDGSTGQGYSLDGPGSGGTLLTIAFQVLVDSADAGNLSLSDVAVVNNLMSGTIDRVKSTFGGNPDP